MGWPVRAVLALPALFINKETNAGGLIQIIPFWITPSPPLPTPAVFEQLDFISRAEAESSGVNLRVTSARRVQFGLCRPDPPGGTRVPFPPLVLLVSGL